MLGTLAAFLPVAVLVTITPGPATAMVVRSAAVGGRRAAFVCTAGNSLGVLAWGLLAAAGLAAVVATPVTAFTVVKLVGAVVLVVLGVQSLRHRPGRGGRARGSVLAWAVTRARRAFLEGPWARRVERLTGVVLLGLGVRLALERR
jgi:threonine/homoserine/homoserine lactone efflux protein